MRKKQAMHLDARYVTMVENAYYYCNPPPVEKAVRKRRPPLQEYIRKLLYKDLSKVTTEKVRRGISLSFMFSSGCRQCLVLSWFGDLSAFSSLNLDILQLPDGLTLR